MNTISFMTANYVARQLGYKMTQGWGQGDKTTNEYFKPPETFGARFEEILHDIRVMGFEAIDLWLAHLNYTWATEEHITTARDLLAQHGLKIASIAGWFGSTPEEFEAACRISVALNCQVLGGSTSLLEKDRPFVVKTLQKYDLKLGLENHPEKSSAVLLERIGDGGNGRIGACVDTGWFGTQGYNAAKAIAELEGYLFHIHLKDVLAPTRPNEHHTCRYGQGVVPVEACVRTLQQLGYQGGISIEHEPDLYDPAEDCIAGLAMVRSWLANKQYSTQ